MKALQDPTITLMVYEPVNEQAYDEPSAVPYVCEVQFYWPECGCVATIGGVINKTADLQGWNARTFVEVPAYTAETYADTPDWYEEWMDEIHLWVTREIDGALLYTSWAEAEAVLRELDTLSVVGALMRRLYDKFGTVDNDIETFENPCLLVQTLALEMCEDLVWRLFENQMDNVGTIPPEAWEYLQATFDQAITETNLFESLWSNL